MYRYLCLLFLTACAVHRQPKITPESLVSIYIVDREGMTEAISNPDRIKNYQKMDFLGPQPYQKVLRVCSRNEVGAVPTYITTYHPNGQVKQYLEVLNNRACGTYQEWHSNGTLKAEGTIIEGMADISLAAEKSWLFDGCTKAFNECGLLIAEIPYSRGQLEGLAKYYHSNGKIWKEIPYKNHAISGEMNLYFESGELLQSTNYVSGMKHGKANRYWTPPDQLSAEECYEKGKLISAIYHNKDGQVVAEIKNGEGFRALFSKASLRELHEYHQGYLLGKVNVYDNEGIIIKFYHMKNDLKHGEEILYYPFQLGVEPQPKLSIMWYEGKIQGLVKTWYENGISQSQKEMSDNKRNGVATAWYLNKQLMLIEEYERDKLIKGDYFRKGEHQPASQVIEGEGTALFFDPEGNYLRKVIYHHGKPDE